MCVCMCVCVMAKKIWAPAERWKVRLCISCTITCKTSTGMI